MFYAGPVNNYLNSAISYYVYQDINEDSYLHFHQYPWTGEDFIELAPIHALQSTLWCFLWELCAIREDGQINWNLFVNIIASRFQENAGLFE